MLTQLKGTCQRFETACHRIGWAPPLLARIVLGWVFIESGWGKLHNLEKVTEFFASLGIPAADIQAPFVAVVEFVGGIMILLGAGTRVASFLLMCVMAAAVYTAKREEISAVSDLFAIYEFVYILLFFWLFTDGAGKISVDEKCCRKTA